MKNTTFAFMFIAVFAVSCLSTPQNSVLDNIPDFSEAVEKEWKLIEVWVDGRNTNFDRAVLGRQGFGEIYTLSFDTQSISGTGAPNRYSAPYTLGDNQTVKIMPVLSTMMASLFEPEGLKEHEFFVFIQNAYEWNLVNQNLELYSKTENGSEVKLVFN